MNTSNRSSKHQRTHHQRTGWATDHQNCKAGPTVTINTDGAAPPAKHAHSCWNGVGRQSDLGRAKQQRSLPITGPKSATGPECAPKTWAKRHAHLELCCLGGSCLRCAVPVPPLCSTAGSRPAPHACAHCRCACPRQERKDPDQCAPATPVRNCSHSSMVAPQQPRWPTAALHIGLHMLFLSTN